MILHDLADRAVSFAIDNGAQYCDARAETIHRDGVIIENGEIENIITRNEHGIGIRVLVDGAWGFCAITNPTSSDETKKSLDLAIKGARYSSKQKSNSVKLYPSSANQARIEYPVLKKPSLDDLIKIGRECDDVICRQEKTIRSFVNPWHNETEKYFVNNEGANITQKFTDTVIEMNAVAREGNLTQAVNATEGGRGGLECILENDVAITKAKEIAKIAHSLLEAKPVKEEKTQIVMNPDFVALLSHEILGHPSEGDRVLGKEMAWAGGAWWSDLLGERIGSEQLNVFDDPTINHSLGWYYFDDEGIPTQKTALVEEGILKNHLQSRETGMIFDTKPTGNMRATNYKFMPLIRMACTCIGAGTWNNEEIIKETKNGYLVSNMKVPSIDMKRYNWSISCQYAHKIENGEITDLLRDVIVLGTAPEFFQSINACGNDFQVRPITNCGKGDPMQSMMMGNGGPTIRGIATVKSVF